MSLFGGSAAPSHSSYESDHSNSSSTRPSPSITGRRSPSNAHTIHVPDAASQTELDVPEADSDFGDDESKEELVEDQTRPNRFRGYAQTWKNYTAADRQVAASLDQMQDADLAAHLYNAHALKRRVRRPADEAADVKNWQSRDKWLKEGERLQYEDMSGLVQTELVPSKDWTAWPLHPEKPHNSDRHSLAGVPSRDSGDRVIGGAYIEDVGEEIKDEVMAVFLRLAKEKWDSRESEARDNADQNLAATSRNRSQSRGALSTKSSRSTSRIDVGMKDAGEVVDVYRRPTMLADDARAERLLQPSIHSLLRQVDSLALALRRTRLNHFNRGASSGGSTQGGFTSDTDSVRPTLESSKRGTKSRERSVHSVSREASARLTKPTTDHGEEHSDSEFASSESSNSSESKTTTNQRKRRRSSGSTADKSHSTTRDWSGRAGLLDWSEVLSLAAVQGWDEAAIARTAQRCSTLFGETVSFTALYEEDASKPSIPQTQYFPSVIPSPDILFKSEPFATKRPLYQTGTLRCPHVGCFGHNRDFALPYRVVEHCMRVHGYDPRTNDSDNEERMVGGVHIDGFLQPLAAKPGWLGHGRTKVGRASKKHKKGDQDSRDVPEVIVSIED